VCDTSNLYFSITVIANLDSFKTCNLRSRKFTATNHVKKQVLVYGLIYGLCGGLLIAALKLIEYRFIVLEHSIEIYGGLTALLFATLGIWLGLKITRKEQVIVERERIVEREVMVPSLPSFALNEQRLQELAITKRELEILGLIAQGLSNREIAEKLFVSENTVKTHSSRLFDKLNARRRTQAVQRGKELGLIP
jgi:two-component system, NarL family, response regulator LiaR